MAASMLSLKDLPGWPLLLSREQAAAYVGVSPALFDREVDQGLWPQPIRRGEKGGRKTWDRRQLDAALDSISGPGPQFAHDDFEQRRQAARAARAGQQRTGTARQEKRRHAGR